MTFDEKFNMYMKLDKEELIKIIIRKEELEESMFYPIHVKRYPWEDQVYCTSTIEPLNNKEL